MERLNVFRKIGDVRRLIEAGIVARRERTRAEQVGNLQKFLEFPHGEECVKERGLKVFRLLSEAGGNNLMPLPAPLRARCLDCSVSVMVEVLGNQKAVQNER